MLRMVSALLMSLGLMMSATVVAQEGQPQYKEGVHYRVLDNPGTTRVPSGKVEVREFFSYMCPHCYSLEPTVDNWLKNKPEAAAYVRTPVLFMQHAEPLARAYFIEESQGLTGEIHRPLFDAIHMHRERLFDADALAGFFEKYGVERDKFNSLYGSFAVSTKVREADALTREYQIRGVPSLVVAGKYAVMRDNLKNNAEMFDVVDFLVKKESEK
ncbi:thiol:disulfide interchange protein DsbA/DsbL [Alloalcanivorax xenomutans]|uniref:thiol:disulfide interchange protein DsbA/DsbL n=1 Tax=Alloalcanivorax xenomutans TaxID=1094342 RepID=UPI00300AA6FC